MQAIVAVDQNWAIGQDGDQLCYLPPDLKRFQRRTTGHPVLLGRKTLATFPGGRPLKNRRNLILSRNPAFAPEGGEVFSALDEALAAAPADTFVIGGESLYRQTLDRCDTVYVTKLHRSFPGADRVPMSTGTWPIPTAPTADGKRKTTAPGWDRDGPGPGAVF